jgi:hypothetical protein
MGEGEMPSEKIQTLHSTGADEPHLRIAWGHDCAGVQVASLFDSKHGADLIIRFVNEWLKAAGLDEVPGREELEKRIKEREPEDSIIRQFGIGFDGFHVSLDDRRDLNQLIAVARRARDQAYGKDE